MREINNNNAASPTSEDKKDHIIRQLSRTTNKKYELYVVTRIIHLLNNLDIKFVTQQYVTRPDGRALTDLYFPQIALHIEVDEPHHKKNIESDKIREADIINATEHKIVRIDVSKPINDINDDINNVIDNINNAVELQKKTGNFVAWDLESEFCFHTYIAKGFIDINDNVAFKTIKDACNCFGHNFSGYQKAGASHPNEPEIMLWFPKLYPNGEWDNQITDDEETITERNKDEDKARKHVERILTRKAGDKHKRIVFARVKGNLGTILYRFRGLYVLDVLKSSTENKLIWKRLNTRVNTYPQATGKA